MEQLFPFSGTSRYFEQISVFFLFCFVFVVFFKWSNGMITFLEQEY